MPVPGKGISSVFPWHSIASPSLSYPFPAQAGADRCARRVSTRPYVQPRCNGGGVSGLAGWSLRGSPSIKEFFPTALPAGLSSAAFIFFLIFALTSSASPGPNNLLIMSVAARSGLRRTLPCILAITLAFGSTLLLGAMGGAAILHHASGPVRILGILGGLLDALSCLDDRVNTP